MYILLGVLLLIMAAVLELGKHTLIGWFLAAAAAGAFVFLYKKYLKKARVIARFLSWITLILVFALILIISWPPVKAVPAVSGKSAGVTDVRHLAEGDVRGVLTEDGKVEVYAGIPYAKPPVGELRWKEPQPADPWEGVLQADHFAPMSMQTVGLPIYDSLARIIAYHDYHISLHDNYRAPASEDSLYLNIWKPAGEEKDLPVLVYVHGGSLQTGQCWYEDYSGEGLARDGVIVVNFGYRLGIFGFFADEALAEESPNKTTGNYGLLDQIMALQWVRDHISAFGGDPENVTLAGESAGACCVTALCTSPLAKGLFRRAVAESSTVTAPEPAHSFRTMKEALAAGNDTKIRLNALNVEELRALPAEKIAPELDVHHHITVDGYALTETPYESYRKGIHNEEAQFQGFNGKESGLFLMLGSATADSFESRVKMNFTAPYDQEVLDLYPVMINDDAKRAWEEIFTVQFFSYGHYCLQRQAASCGIPSYSYYFTKDNKRLSSNHSGEEVYLYGNIPERSSRYDESDRSLMKIMKQYFVNFIRTGDPNGDGLPEWPEATGDGRVLEFGEEIRMTDPPGQKLYGILDRMYGYQE